MPSKTVAACLQQPLVFEQIDPARKNRVPISSPRYNCFAGVAIGRYPVLDYAAQWCKTHMPALEKAKMEQPPDHDRTLNKEFPAWKSDELQFSLRACIFGPVNEAMRVLGVDARMSTSGHITARPVPGGAHFHVTARSGKVLAEGRRNMTHQIHTRRIDQWFNLLGHNDAEQRNRVAETACQLLMYTTINQVQFGFLASNLYWVFMWRGESAEQNKIWFSVKIPVNLSIQHQEQRLTLRILVASQVFKAAQEGSRITRDIWAIAPEPNQQWCDDCEAAANSVTWPAGEEEDEDGEFGHVEDKLQWRLEQHRSHHRKNGTGDEAYDEEDIAFQGEDDAAVNTTQCSSTEKGFPQDGPQRQTLSAPDSTSYHRDSGGIDNLPRTPYHNLLLGKVLYEERPVTVSLVREGSWNGQPAVIKLVDISEDSRSKAGLARHICALKNLEAHQVKCVPKVLACGECFGGLLKWVAMSPAGTNVRDANQVSAREALSMARESLSQVHAAGILHGNAEADNSLVKDGQIFLTGFSRARLCNNAGDFDRDMSDLDLSIEYWLP